MKIGQIIKSKGIRIPRVESSIFKRKPINTQARLVTAPRPYWADPQKVTRPSYESLEGEVVKLKQMLSDERKMAGLKLDSLVKRSQLLKSEVERLTSCLSICKARANSNFDVQKAIKKIGEIYG